MKQKMDNDACVLVDSDDDFDAAKKTSSKVVER